MSNITTARIAAAALVGTSMMTVPTASVSAAACQSPNGAGCLLPLAPRSVAAPIVRAPVTAAPVVAEEVVRRGFPILAVLAGLAAVGGILALVLSSDDNDDDQPVSP